MRTCHDHPGRGQVVITGYMIMVPASRPYFLMTTGDPGYPGTMRGDTDNDSA
ncbi:MAG: hypothetical protein WC382_07745 [Methanoregulaceae archaeon]